jgi:hypothetical protein
MPNGAQPPLPTLAQAITPSSRHGMSKLSCCDNSWPTLCVVTMGLGTTLLQLRPPTETLRLLTCRSLLRQESFWRPTTSFRRSSPSLGSCTAQRIRRSSSPHGSCGETQVCGGPTTLPLTPQTTKCHGTSFVKLFAPITSWRA